MRIGVELGDQSTCNYATSPIHVPTRSYTIRWNVWVSWRVFSLLATAVLFLLMPQVVVSCMVYLV